MRNLAGGSRSGSAAFDGLDDNVWRRLQAIVGVAFGGDADEFARLWQKLEAEVTDDQRGLAGIYVWYLLEYRVHDILQRRPVPADLHRLASDGANSRFLKIIKKNEASLENTLRTIFKFASGDEQVTAGRLLVAGSAAISALLDDTAQLDAMRAPLGRWYSTHAARFRELGSMAPPPPAPSPPSWP